MRRPVGLEESFVYMNKAQKGGEGECTSINAVWI